MIRVGVGLRLLAMGSLLSLSLSLPDPELGTAVEDFIVSKPCPRREAVDILGDEGAGEVDALSGNGIPDARLARMSHLVSVNESDEQAV